MTEAGPRDTSLASLVLRGRGHAELAGAVEGARLVRTMDGASTLTLTVGDQYRRLVNSPLLRERALASLDGRLFELVQVRKAGSTLTIEFEDAAVADLRRVLGSSATRAGVTTRVGYARRLVGQVPGLRLVGPAGPAQRVPFGSGNGQGQEPGWGGLNRLFVEDLAWRRFVIGKDVVVAPDPWLYARSRPVELREHAGGVDDIDFDVDTGKSANTATVRCSATRWGVPPGSPVTLPALGPASGPWLVNEIDRSLFSTEATIGLVRVGQPLPPPKPEARDDSKTTQASGPRSGFAWPVASGSVSSGFGPRNGRPHAGIDITVPIGTAVLAAKDGVVDFAGDASGYGTVIYLDHGTVSTRYAHLSRLEVRRGEQVRRGQRIGLSGNSGNSTGPHLHFEVRPGGRAADPLSYLPSRR